jgi:hypothetical protein
MVLFTLELGVYYTSAQEPYDCSKILSFGHTSRHETK